MFLAVVEGEIAVQSQFYFTDGADVFFAEVYAIKEAIADAHRRVFGELVINSDSKSALQTLNSFMSRHRTIDLIRDLVRRSEVVVHMHWVRAHDEHTYNERVDALAKVTIIRPEVDVEVKVTHGQAKREIFGRALSRRQDR